MPHPDCKHHWIIDQHNHGGCKLCGDTKQFPGIGDIPDMSTWRGKTKKFDGPREEVDMSTTEENREDDLAATGFHEVVTAEQVQNEEAPFTAEELSQAKAADVNLAIKSKKEQKRRRHEPNSTLKNVKCEAPGCSYECDPRALHLHVMQEHGSGIGRNRKTPKRIVRRIAELFDAGTPQVEIIAALKLQNNFDITASSICGILNRERPNRVKKGHHQHQAPADQPSKKVDQEVGPSELLLEVMGLIVAGAPGEEIRDNALKVKKRLSKMVMELSVLSRLVDEIINYANITLEDNIKP